jgi:adenine/guanine/hypoxanthine permease
VLLISSLWTRVLGFSSARLYDRILPGIAISLVSGNMFYAWQAYQLAKRTGRTDVMRPALRNRYLVPIEAGMAIVLWIGIVMVAQAFQATPREHAPAVAVGLLPGIAAWGALMLKTGMRVAGLGSSERPFTPAILDAIGRADVAAAGAFALEQGFLLTSMVWAAITVEIIERRFVRAALWALGGSALSMAGLVHSYAFTTADTVQDIAFAKAWPFALGYAALALLLALGRFAKRDDGSDHAGPAAP